MVKVYGIGFTTVFIDCLLESLGFASVFGKCGIDQWGKSRNHQLSKIQIRGTGWGPQDSVQLPYKWLNSMVYGRYNELVNGGYIARNLHGLFKKKPVVFDDTVARERFRSW